MPARRVGLGRASNFRFLYVKLSLHASPASKARGDERQFLSIAQKAQEARVP